MLDMSLLDFVALSCGVWVTSFMIANPAMHGPWGILHKFRTRFPLGGLTHCIYCTGFWAAVVMVGLMVVGLHVAVYVYGAWGAAMLVGNYTGSNP